MPSCDPPFARRVGRAVGTRARKVRLMSPFGPSAAAVDTRARKVRGRCAGSCGTKRPADGALRSDEDRSRQHRQYKRPDEQDGRSGRGAACHLRRALPPADRPSKPVVDV